MAVAIRHLLLPLLVCLAGLAALGQSALRYQASLEIQRRGVLAPVQSIVNEKKIKQSGDHITYAADVTYTGADGRPVTARVGISDAGLDAFRSGRPTQVAYLPDRPETVRIAGEEDAGSSWLLVLIGIAALGYGGIRLFQLSRRSTPRSTRR
jgi:hypothetical protein